MKAILILMLSVVLSNTAVAETYSFVGTTFPFILEQKPNGEIYGLGADIARKVVQRLGHNLTITMYPFKRALRMIERGEADVFIGPYKSAERETFMSYNTYAFYQDPMVFYGKADLSFIWGGEFSSLEGKRIGLTRGWSYGTKFDQYKKNLQTDTADTVKANFQKLLVDRIDLFATHPRNASKLIDELHIKEKVKMLLPPIIVNKGYYGFSKKRNLEKFLIQFDLEFKKMIESGEILQLNQKYNLYFVNE